MHFLPYSEHTQRGKIEEQGIRHEGPGEVYHPTAIETSSNVDSLSGFADIWKDTFFAIFLFFSTTTSVGEYRLHVPKFLLYVSKLDRKLQATETTVQPD